MLQKMIFAAALLISSVSMAGQQAYEVQVEFAINGKVVSKPIIHTLAGETATLTQENDKNTGTFIEVVADEGQGQIKGNKAILMKFKIGTIENGQRKILATPQIMTLEKNKAEITVGRSEEKDQVSLAVTAERL